MPRPIPRPVGPLIVGGYRRLQVPFGEIKPVTRIPLGYMGSYALEGFTLDALGMAIGSMTVRVFNSDDNTLIGTTVSDAVTGAFRIVLGIAGPFYVVVYKTGSPDVFGTSVNTLIASA